MLNRCAYVMIREGVISINKPGVFGPMKASGGRYLSTPKWTNAISVTYNQRGRIVDLVITFSRCWVKAVGSYL